MEFPNLGQHCNVPECKQLDFLPIKCDLCQETFCNDHFSYITHSCPKAHTIDVQVPVCPLCNQPVPSKRGELPDIAVGAHIDKDCQDDRAMKQRNAVYTNRCTRKGCKQKEMIPVLCSECKKNFCLKHRHSADHDCDPREARIPKSVSQAERTANNIFSKIQSFGDNVKNSLVQSTSRQQINEDEALARALQASLLENGATGGSNTSSKPTRPSAAPTLTVQEEEDRQLAAAIAASQRDFQKNKDKCIVS